ncbi:hypothetical protein [Massilia sp. NP310]|uniref:hypothetical protein n=1 Tax=Massilia sp. NP310 TaxID=2861282 RepID=UPI001C635559|nr:hypothetical protein [Massilia sp. NP310]QYG01890.1 hypothetical protein KY496_00030 [Massilia sp. NP310]
MRKITALMDPSQNPNQLQDQETFDTNMAGLIDGFVLRGEQENALADDMEELFATMSATAAGGAYSFPYVFDSSTADGDPGVGKLRLSNGNQTAAALLRIDNQIVGGVDISPVFADLGAVTSAKKGSIRLVKQSDPSKWITFDVTAVATPTGYRNLSVVSRVSSGINPFANGDALLVFIERNGDKGEDAVGALQLLSSVTVSAAVAQINFLSLFTSAYDKYIIEIQGLTPAAAAILRMRLAVGGVIDSSSLYNPMSANSGGGNAANTLEFYELSALVATMTVEVRNTNSSGLTTIGVRGAYTQTSTPLSVTKEGVYRGTAPVTGFSLYFSSGNITAGTVRVYGVKNNP